MTVGGLFSAVASACDGATLPAGSRFDALHIIAHGHPGRVQLCKDNLTKQNLHVPVRTFNGPQDEPFDLEKLIFGAAKKP